jgi:hypothetical protein
MGRRTTRGFLTVLLLNQGGSIRGPGKRQGLFGSSTPSCPDHPQARVKWKRDRYICQATGHEVAPPRGRGA